MCSCVRVPDLTARRSESGDRGYFLSALRAWLAANRDVVTDALNYSK